MGLGCWAIGGTFYLDGKADGYGDVDDAESIRAIQTAIDLGVTFFDTSDAYGTGHSERVLGQAVRHRRAEVGVATLAIPLVLRCPIAARRRDGAPR
jgi:aryl-alcohol dehydrogenase-like predicted oxidoreductase